MNWLKKCLQLWLEWIIFAPLLLVVNLLAIPDSSRLLWFVLLAFSSVIGMMVRGVLRLRRNWILLPLTFVWSIGINEVAVGWYFSTFSGSLQQWIFAILATLLFHFITFYRGTLIISRHWEELFPLQLQWSGLVLYFFSYFFFRFTPELEPYLNWIFWLGLLSLGFVLWNGNSLLLREATHSRFNGSAVPRPLRHMNRTMILLCYLVIIMIGSFRQIITWLEQLMNTLFAMIPKGSEEEPPLPPPQQAPDFQLDEGMAPSEPSLFWRILEQIFYWAVGIALVVGLIGLLIKVAPKLGQHIVQLMRKFLAFMKRSQDDPEPTTSYIDEESKLDGWEEWRKSLRSRFDRWRQRRERKEPKWEDLADNREKVRFLYRKLLTQAIESGYSFRSQLTPLETVRDIQRWIEQNLDSSAKLGRGTEGSPWLSKLAGDDRQLGGNTVDHKQVEQRQVKQRQVEALKRHDRVANKELKAKYDDLLRHAEEWIALYNRARYSDEAIADELVIHWKQISEDQ